MSSFDSETEQQACEREYNEEAPTNPLSWSKKRIHKLPFRLNMEEAEVLFVNFQYQDSPKTILEKFMGLVTIMPKSLRLIILTMPPNAVKMDFRGMAENLQMMYQELNKITCFVLFIRHEDKLKITQQLYVGRGGENHLIEGFMLHKASLALDKILYSWGSCSYGKLGIGHDIHIEHEDGKIANFYNVLDKGCAADCFERFDMIEEGLRDYINQYQYGDAKLTKE